MGLAADDENEEDDGMRPFLHRRLALTVPSFAEAFETSVSKTYAMMQNGEIPFRMLGRIPIISVDDALRWYRSLPLRSDATIPPRYKRMRRPADPSRHDQPVAPPLVHRKPKPAAASLP